MDYSSKEIMTEADCRYMHCAIELAKKGTGWTSPNPLVGAVIVRDGRIIGEGYHERYGDLHAERNALKHCTESPEGAVMYVTLEPCCHHGKQPPCTEAVIEAGIRKVYIGSDDPNPLVAGKGLSLLRSRGIEVVTGVCKEECDALNAVFFHYIRTKTPYVVMKYAMTMDGKIAAKTGDSKWITDEKARARVHMDRHKYTGIMVGVGTVLKDDPMLNCRAANTKSPVRIICDTHLNTPLTSQIVQTADVYQTIIATCCDKEEKQAAYIRKGCRILQTDEKNGHVDLNALMQQLGREGIDSILLEGGPTLNWSALESGIVHKVQAYIAPKLLGGAGAKSPIEGSGISKMSEAVMLKNTRVTQIGEDFLIESEVTPNVYRDC